MTYALAIDIGASSGRHIVGWEENGNIETREVFRFPNSVSEENGFFVWNTESLVDNVKKGIEEALKQYPLISSLAIDTWGVDYVLLNGEDSILPCLAYRNGTSDEIINEVHSLIPFEELYSRTGIQFQRFNTIYQLYRDKKSGKLDRATDFLLMPEYLLYRLCGVKSHEYTEATTGGYINAETGECDTEIIDKLGLPRTLFKKLSKPGTTVGYYKNIKCVLCASHDTASAIYSIPMENDDIYISSGTWSILGVKTACPLTDEKSRKTNFSNEGGVGCNTYLKNIMGMWIVNRLRDELCPEKDFKAIVEEAKTSSYVYTIDAQDDMFLAPENMKKAFDKALEDSGSKAPETEADYFRCAYNSLAQTYSTAIDELEKNTGRKYKKIYIVGGGAKNTFLNELTEKATGKTVVALPIEATAIGNIKTQLWRKE